MVMRRSKKKVEQVNINCLICHQEKAIVHKWLDGDIDRNAIYGKKEGSHFDPKYKTLKKSPILGQAVFVDSAMELGPTLNFLNLPSVPLLMEVIYMPIFLQEAPRSVRIAI